MSSEDTSMDAWRNGKFHVDTFWEQTGKYYNYSRAKSCHNELMNNLRILYGYDKPYLVKEVVQGLYDKMYYNFFRNYDQWFDEVFHKANFAVMLQYPYYNR
ncbi:MAG: hypothetical protein ABI687_13765 [Flavitalea sp.]